MNGHKFSIDEAVGFGWGVAKRNVIFFLLIFVIAAVASGIFQGVQDATKEQAPFISLLFALAGLFVTTVVSIGFTRISLKFADGETPRFEDLFTGYPLFVNFFFASVLYGLIVIVGLILLIVPGIMWAVRFSQFSYLVVDKGLSPAESLRKSADITQGARWHLVLFALILLGINLLGALALGIGLLWTIPTAMVAAAHVYRKLLAHSAPAGPEVPVAPSPTMPA
jgi:uncharacterized membrane protein